MDYDTLVVLYSILVSDKIKSEDIMLLTSAINNGNFDLNMSIIQNYYQAKDSEEYYAYKSSFDVMETRIVNTPIYKLFLKKRVFWDLLLRAFDQGILLDDVLEDVIVSLFNLVDCDNYTFVLGFIDKLLVPAKVKVSKKNPLLINYVSSNIDLFMGHDELVPIIFKLFSCGFITLKDIKAVSFEAFQKILVFLLDDVNYSYFLTLLNASNLDCDTIEAIEFMVENASNLSLKYRNIINTRLISEMSQIVNTPTLM